MCSSDLRGVRTLDAERQRAAAFLAGGKADRFRGRDLGVALAHDFGPAGDHRALDEAEALERHAPDVERKLARGAGAEMRVALGTAVFSGMIGVTLFGIFFTPVFYSLVTRSGPRRVLDRPGAQAVPSKPS